jgi:small conductance mechanosensitive channel
MEQMQQYVMGLFPLLVSYLPSILQALLVLLVGLWLIRLVVRLIDKGMNRANTDVSLQKFLLSIVGIGLKALLFISVASMVGIATTSFVAILGAAGLAVGLALQGSLANFAGGVLILMFKPFKVGDYIDAAGHSGSVESIQVFNTVLKTPDNKTIILPNGAVSSGSIINFSTEKTRRVDFVFGIGYGDDIDKAKNILEGIIQSDERILENDGNLVAVSALADSSVNFTVRVWVEAGNYWPVYFSMFEKVKKAFETENISIPYPQTDVHLYQTAS